MCTGVQAMVVLALATAADTQSAVEQWRQFELELHATIPHGANPFEVSLTAEFSLSKTKPPPARAVGGSNQVPTTTTTVAVTGFYDGGTTFRVRFAPPAQGNWTYTTASSLGSLAGARGSVRATSPTAGVNRGPVTSAGYELRYADGTKHVSVGTTSYQWASKGLEMQNQTLETLRSGPDGQGPVFNKIRMTVFPKWCRCSPSSQLTRPFSPPFTAFGGTGDCCAW